VFRVDTTIPHGNACDISIAVGEQRAEVGFAADPHGGPECLWFCFRLSRDETEVPTGEVRLVLKHPYNMLGGDPAQDMRPVIRYQDGDWTRLEAGTVEGLADGRSRVVWVIEEPLSYVDLAACYPYGVPDVEALIRETEGYWHADTIGVSQGARPLVRLSNNYGTAGDDRPGLYLVARQHAGETPGSWVLDGLLRYIASLGSDAPLVWAVPLANVDGVMGGDYGKDNFPYDLNRAWGTPPMRHEVLAIQRDIQRWKARCHPVLAIDFHAPGACETSGIYCYLPDPSRHPDRCQEALTWSTAIKSMLTERYAAQTFERVANYPSRWETPHFSTYCWTEHGVCGLGLETPYAMVGDLVLTRGHYREAGARAAVGIVKKLRME
jgi:hypothetical protein